MSQEKASTRTKIMAAGHELFWKHGFKRVSIVDICEKCGVSKMTFYRYFPNKAELAKSIYDKVINEGYQQFQSILKEDSSSEVKMQKMLMMKKEGTNQISPEFLADFYMNKESELKQFVQERVGQLMKNMIGDFREAQKKGIFRSDFNPEFIFHISYKLSESLDDPQLLKMFDNTQDLIMELSRFFIYGVAPHN